MCMYLCMVQSTYVQIVNKKFHLPLCVVGFIITRCRSALMSWGRINGLGVWMVVNVHGDPRLPRGPPPPPSFHAW